MRQVAGTRQTGTTAAAPSFLRTFQWPRFRNTGTSICAPGVTLGTTPGGVLQNAMELVFTERSEASSLRRRLAPGGYAGYRVRQTVEEQVWQAVHGRWHLLTATSGVTPDDPDPALQCWDSPEMRTVDTPGFSLFVHPSTRVLSFEGGVVSDPRATAIWVQQNFYTWVEGEAFTGRRVASVRFPWHNSLYLERPSATAHWAPGEHNHIQSGHMAMGVTARSHYQ